MHEKGANQDCGYDFEIIEPDNNSVEYFIACKGLFDNASTFYMTGDEWKSCTANNRNYQGLLGTQPSGFTCPHHNRQSYGLGQQGLGASLL